MSKDSSPACTAAPTLENRSSFFKHREYVPGDDLRHVDWQVWARQDRLYIKQYEEDTNLRCHLLVDVSGSMQYGKGLYDKLEYGCTIAACLSYLILKQQDAVGGVTFDEQLRDRIPVSSRRNHVMSIVEALQRQEARNKSGLFEIMKHVAETFPRRGLMIVISDLLSDTDETLRGLRLLKRKGHDVMVFHVLDRDEVDFPFRGPTRFEDIEGGEFLNCNPSALRDGYLEALQTFLDQLRHGCAKEQIDYQQIRTDEPFDVVLVHYLNHRLGGRRRS